MINLYVYNNFDALSDQYLYWHDRMVGQSNLISLSCFDNPSKIYGANTIDVDGASGGGLFMHTNLC